MSNNDQYYIDLVLSGDSNAFGTLVDRYKDLVFTLAIRMTKNKEDAEEVCQETFLKAYRYLNKYKGSAKFSTWIYRIAYNTSADHLKKGKKDIQTIVIDEFTENQLSSIDDQLANLEADEQSAVIKRTLDLLSNEDSFLLTLYYFEDMSVEEISKVVELKPNNVKVKLHRGRKRLATLLKEQLVSEKKIKMSTDLSTKN